MSVYCFRNHGLQSPSPIIPCLNVSLPAWPAYWQRCPCSAFPGGYHLFLVVCHLQRGAHGCKRDLPEAETSCPRRFWPANLQILLWVEASAVLGELVMWKMGTVPCGASPPWQWILAAFIHFQSPSVHLFTHAAVLACYVVIDHQITSFICGSIIITAYMYNRPCENTNSVWYKHSAAIAIDKGKHVCCTLSFNRDLNCLAVKLSLRIELGYSFGNAKRKEAGWKLLPNSETEDKVNAFQVKREKNSKKVMYEVFQIYVKRLVLWLLFALANV